MSKKNNSENNEIKEIESKQEKGLGIDKSESGNINNEEIKQIMQKVIIRKTDIQNSEQ